MRLVDYFKFTRGNQIFSFPYFRKLPVLPIKHAQELILSLTDVERLQQIFLLTYKLSMLFHVSIEVIKCC